MVNQESSSSSQSNTTNNIQAQRQLANLASLELNFSDSDRSLFSSFRSSTNGPPPGIDLSERSAASQASGDNDTAPTEASTAASTVPPLPTGFYHHNPSSFSSSEAPDRRESNFSLGGSITEGIHNESFPIVEDVSIDESEEHEEERRDSLTPLTSYQERPSLSSVASLRLSDLSRASRPAAAATPAHQVEDVDEEEEVNTRGVSFGNTKNLYTDSIRSIDFGSDTDRDLASSGLLGLIRQESNRRLSDPPLPEATAVSMDNSDSEINEDSTHSLRGNGAGNSRAMVPYGAGDSEDEAAAHSLPPPPVNKKKKGVLRNKGKTGPINNNNKSNKTNGKRANRLSKTSLKYDLDGSGNLDSIEQAMRDRDIDGDGNLDNEEIYRIVQDQLKSQHDVALYRKVAAALTCLVAILALSNFGTSWATAILSRETVADAETSTIQSSKSHDVIGIQQVSHEIDLEPLTDEEFEERRRLVDAEMLEDPEHEDHVHRRLGTKDNNHVCTCTKIAYDHGKVEERALKELIKKCDGTNTVSIKKKWKNSDTYDIDTICGPGTNVVKKGKKKNNKKKTKTKVVEEQIKFRRKGSGKNKDKGGEISFSCKGGFCFGSGQTLLQQEGHPCNLRRDFEASECDDGLLCYDDNGDGVTGTCTMLVRYARKNQVCDRDFGVDACEGGLACYSENKKKRSSLMGVVNTGFCKKVTIRVSNQDVCDASNGRNACEDGFTCIGENGRELNGFGIGYCQRLAIMQRSGGLCDLGLGRDACDNGFYCQDSTLLATRNGGGNGNGLGAGGNAWTGATLIGPSGVVNGGAANGGLVATRGRTVGTGTCARIVGVRGVCRWDDECGFNGKCVGLGADTATGGVIRGSSGTIVWGTGGSTTGICG